MSQSLFLGYFKRTNNPEVVICGDHIRRGNCPATIHASQVEGHLRAEHNIHIGPVVCGLCGWRFVEHVRFARHEFVHIMKNPCMECGIQFRTANDRFAHLCERHGLSPENS